MRTTLNIDAHVLRELRKLQKASGKSLGQLASELLVQAIAGEQKARAPRPFRWASRPMGALVDIADKDTLYRVLDERG